ncbi:MAG: Regulatory protein AtoC [Pseudomonadales bacterium]|nr:Regulatory protein AtoC [Pseudomonadales bacterium]
MRESPVRGMRVLIVEDDHELREALADTLDVAGCEVEAAAAGAEALARLAHAAPDVLVSDVNMPGMDGHELLRHARRSHPQVPVVLITAFGSIERSVRAMRDGASDYLVKPFEPAQLIEVIARLGPQAASRGEDPVAVAPASVELLALARRVAATDSTVLLCGESGTGKEVLARYIHRRSARAASPFVAVNCAAIPENMLEAMLFGHEKGAFTGAHAAMPGKFEQADGGTLLLDEISEMDAALQAKLLRVLQEREVERLGGRRPQAVDVRVIATTNRDLRAEMAAGRFREDLYYRLGVFPLHCRPLRERVEDILPLAGRLVRAHAAKMRHVPVEFAADARAALLAHPWPGNVRELDNAMQRALILQDGAAIGAAHLRLEPAPGAESLAPFRSEPASHPPAVAAAEAAEPGGAGDDLRDELRQSEFRLIVGMLRDTRGSRNDAAERLGISPRTLRYKLARLRESGFDVEAALRA